MIKVNLPSAARRIEDFVAVASLIILALIPTTEIILRLFFRTGIPASTDYMYHAVLWVAFTGGMITSRKNDHLSLSIGIDSLKEPLRSIVKNTTTFISVAISSAFFWSALSLMLNGFDPDRLIGFIPIRFITFIMPLGFGVMSFRFIFQKGLSGTGRIIAAVGLIGGVILAIPPIVNIIYTITFDLPLFVDGMVDFYYLAAGKIIWILFIVLVGGTLFGIPLFIVLGGVAYILFAANWGALEVITNEAYTMLTNPSIPAIPLFTLTGFLLSESKAGERFINLFRSLFGRLTGGMAIVAILVCTFFTTFTGASGVTILALGGLLSYVMIKSGLYSKRFSNGLLTASGSIGLLFPPSLPIILYGVVAQVSIKSMFIGGIVPGLIMVIALIIYGVITARRGKKETAQFTWSEVGGSLLESFWEVLLPIIIIVGYFSGLFTLVETGAVAVVYTLIVEVWIKRDISIRDISRVVLKSLPIIGGILILLAVAKGLSYYLVDAEIPMKLVAWAGENIHSKYVFLLLLNLALLVAGCLMDIFSAILVIVPLILPLGELFGIHPVHLGIIFLANLELGYLTPPVGLNLFLASYRFEEPLIKVYRNVIPFFLILLITVLLITYVPFLSMGLLKLFG
ncbi:MAG: TRAP transporter large permease subunit [Spirochaetales bacterium]|nr:TRAP transporter large permease subunit [Spirochaetales bacterium]